MKYYRLIRSSFGDTPLGYGRAGGRWNLPGTPLIYAASSSALCFMELLAIKGPVVSSAKWLLLTLDVPDEVPHLVAKDLPADWRWRPYPVSTQRFGTSWAQSVSMPFLKVPSCRIPLSAYPVEHNLLINPLHPERTKLVDIVSSEEVSFELNRW